MGLGDWVRQYDYIIIQSRFFDLAVCLLSHEFFHEVCPIISHEFFQKGIFILLHSKRFALVTSMEEKEYAKNKKKKQFKIGLILCKKRFWGWMGVTI